MTTPPLMKLLYLVHAKDTKYFARFIAAAGSTVFFLVMFSINLLSSIVREAAHKSSNVLYTFLFRVNVSTFQRMKIMAFIEKLDLTLGSIVGNSSQWITTSTTIMWLTVLAHIFWFLVLFEFYPNIILINEYINQINISNEVLPQIYLNI